MTADRLFETTSIPGHLAPTPERLERLLSKQTLEELYEVEEQPFARGKYATVRRCRERASGRQWAAKFLKKRRRAKELKAEALHEVAVLDAAAHCPQLVTLHQVFETNTEMVLVLELASGGELQMVLDRDEVPEERQVVRLLRQILEGIAFLHSHNVAHLDIKPQNLVLTGDFPDCDVKLCDFGISRYISQGADIREILGTPDYVAPEVLNYESISLATDMWSVGVLLYVLLTGCSPFGGDTKQETFCNISRCRLDFPDDLFEDVSEEARDLMQKLMVKDPSKRLTVTECLQHPWLTMYIDPQTSVTLTTNKIDKLNNDNIITTSRTEPIITNEKCSSPESDKKTINTSTIEIINENEVTDSAKNELLLNNNIKKLTINDKIQQTTTPTTTTTIYSKQRSPTMPLRIGLSPDRRDTFKRNMDSLAQKFSSGAEIVIIEQTNNTQRRAIGNHTMPTGEVFKCTPVFILGEEQQCSDSNSDTVSEISTDSSSDRSSIYSDDSLDFILYGKNQGRSSYPFSGIETDRWDHRHTRAWPRECNGVVSKALSRFTTEPHDNKINNNNNNTITSSSSSSLSSLSSSSSSTSTTATTSTTVSLTSKAKTGLEALRERGGNLVVIREPVRAGRYTRYSEVQCESVQARIRRFQIQGGS